MEEGPNIQDSRKEITNQLFSLELKFRFEVSQKEESEMISERASAIALVISTIKNLVSLECEIFNSHLQNVQRILLKNFLGLPTQDKSVPPSH